MAEANPARVSFDGTQVCVQFSYSPLKPIRRYNLVRTVTDVVIQTGETFIESDMVIKWSVEAGVKADYDFFRDKLTAANPTYNFIGYWGDICTVKFLELDDPKVEARNWYFGGLFQVVAVTSYSDPGMPC